MSKHSVSPESVSYVVKWTQLDNHLLTLRAGSPRLELLMWR